MDRGQGSEGAGGGVDAPVAAGAGARVASSFRAVVQVLLPSLAFTLLSTFPFLLHVRDALPGGQLGASAQRAFWLPWQLYANVASGRGLWDSSGFLSAPDAGLPALVGNPGISLLLAPLHALGAPALAHNLGLLLLHLTNITAAWLVGAGTRPRPRGVLAAAVVAGAGLWTWQLAGGALAAAWIAPGLGALAAAQRGLQGPALLLAGVGVAFAPFPTAAALVGGVFVGAAPRVPGGLAVAALGVALGGLAPSALRGDALDLPLGAVSWASSGDVPGLPFLFLFGIGAAWRGRRTRTVAVAALILALAALGAASSSSTLRPIDIDGFRLPSVFGPVGAAHGPELLSAALVLALLVVLTRAGRARFGRGAELALVALALLEPRLQVWRGQPVALWHGDVWPAPDALLALAAAPYTTPILQLPLLEVREGLVGFVPLHRQAVSGGPGQDRGGPARAGLLARVRSQRALQAVKQLEDGGEPRDLMLLVGEAGYSHVLVVGDDPALRVAMHRSAGPATYEDELFALWSATPDVPSDRALPASGRGAGGAPRPGDGPGYGRPGAPPGFRAGEGAGPGREAAPRPGDGPGNGRPALMGPGQGPGGPGTGYGVRPQGAGVGADPRRPGAADVAGPNAPPSKGVP